MKKVLVLGAGMVGSAMAIDLSQKFKVTSADISTEALQFLKEKYGIQTVELNVKDKNKLMALLPEFDYVVSAVPGFLGYETLSCIIDAGKNVVDITFMPEDILTLHEKALKNNVTAIVDCGVAPGMPNLIAGYFYERMQIEKFFYMVGGLPKERTFPFEYKAPFSPIDVIEEYTRPARFLQNNILIEKPAMSDAELIHFDGIGTLEAFNTDGLRSLLYTLANIPNISEKTLRYPGHIRLIQALQTAGFFSDKALNVNGVIVKPVEMTNKILFKSWKYEPNEEDFTVMRIIIDGKMEGKQMHIVFDLYDEYDKKTCISSMARTTGYTGTAALNMIHEGLLDKKGVFPPEIIGKSQNCYAYIMNYLKERGIHYKKTES
ncbi:MAG: saccharopine dehydrogenase C-terminal domain-containing protein [Bacteroidales bacterium]|nr:saccharopine dehydrogenase C-terminal domain-containing protein [Bacteroidales bacterium]